MPDYGKMAWLRTEELLARVEALENRKGLALGLTLNEEVLRSVTEHNLITLPVQGEAGGSVEFRAALTVLGGEAGAGRTEDRGRKRAPAQSAERQMRISPRASIFRSMAGPPF